MSRFFGNFTHFLRELIMVFENSISLRSLHSLNVRRSAVVTGLTAAALMAVTPAQAAQLTWNLTFFDEAGVTVGNGQFITESDAQNILMASDPNPFNPQTWTSTPTRNILETFSAVIDGVSWSILQDSWGDWDRMAGYGIRDDGTGDRPRFDGFVSWLDDDGDLTRRFGFNYPSVYIPMGPTPRAGWMFRDGGFRSISWQGLSMAGNMLNGTSLTNTWEQDHMINRGQPGMRQVKNQGTWTATLATPASTPEPGTALGLMAIGLWAWQRRSPQNTEN